MRVARALLRRSAVQAGQLAAALLVAAIGSGAVVALVSLPEAAIARGVTTLLAEAEPTAGALRVETALPRGGGDTQDERVREALADAVGTAPLDTLRSLRSEPLVASVAGADRSLVLGVQEHLDALAELVDGTWAAGGDEVTISEPAARELGIAAGDELEVAGESLRVAGVWRALDSADAAWFGETLVASGRLGDAVGPVIVPERLLDGLEVRPRVSWTLVPRPDVAVGELPALGAVERRVSAATSGLASGTSYAVTVSGTLAATVARAEQAVASARVLSATAVVLALVSAGIVLALVGRALSQVRTPEWRLLTARGLSRGRGVALALVESFVVIAVGVALGTTAVVLLAAATDAVVPPAGVLAAVACAVAGTLLLAATARPEPAGRERGRAAETESVIPAIGAAVLAGFALVTAAAVPASPAAYVAPALALVAGVLLLRLALAPVLRVAERLAARGTGLLPVLPLRQLGRRPRSVASAFVVVALAVGTVVVAGLSEGAVSRDAAAAVRSAIGGDLRLSFTSVDRDPVTAEPYASVDGVDAAAEVALVTAEAGSTQAALVIAGDGFAEVTRVAPPASADELEVRVASALASRLGVTVGDVVPLELPGVREALSARIAEIAPVPGTGATGMLVARDALAALLPAEATTLAVDEVWLASSDPESTAERVRAAGYRAVTVLTPAGASSRAVTDAGGFATGAAAAVVVLVGIGGFAAAAAGLSRLRRGEVIPLRALGVGAGSQARGRVVELLLTALAGAVAGAVAGVLATRLAAGEAIALGDLASVVPLVLAGLLVVGVLAVSLAAGAGARRDAGVRS
ncbi:hypothetical protein H4J02_04545 [Protaetiibacter sp. SSC-01]|uniref:hypothetical protein n=1 Tax=Protaetiibacter sp. SSC-01 TaxID=2759943 RepID=UPI001656D2EE|nr:hypothetical protein [Protaetiibacter sp. SSC-01]QNO38295.1 hypothetical protein H4J02_04545 [Protaetiibacter sp. SSC-01]